jgi:hypothetical protein
MCAINPKHQKHFRISVYTSEDITEEAFRLRVLNKVLATEMALNADARLRWHITEERHEFEYDEAKMFPFGGGTD